MDLPNHLKIHPDVHVIQTTPHKEQPADIDLLITPQKSDPVPMPEGEEQVVGCILKHRKRARGYQFLTLMKRAPNHEAEWKHTKDVDHDSTVTEVRYNYILENGIFPEYH